MRDVYVVSAARTPITRADKGGLAHCHPADMAAAAVRAAVERAGVAADQVADLVLGCAFPEAAQGMNVARIAQARAGLPDATGGMTLNRLCASGLEAIAHAAMRMSAGGGEAAIAGGVESMSLVPMGGYRFSPNPGLTRERPEVYLSMGRCGDNVARDFGLARETLDAYALESHRRALAAQDAGRFDEEIIPVEAPAADGPRTIAADEGPRRDTSPEGLAKLPPAFAAPGAGGVCTAGNSSQRSDGAAAVCLMSRAAMDRAGAQPLGRLLSYAVAGGTPTYLGPAQVEAVKAACAQASVRLAEMDLIELNEAFASVALYVIGELALDRDKVNVNGGAIALGHPLGCTGAKLSVQLLYELRRRQGRYGLVTMCVGGGMGAAGVFERCP